MWGCARLPNGAIIRSAWMEKTYDQEHICISRNVKFVEGGQTLLGEVQYFAHIAVDDANELSGLRWEAVAVIWLYSELDHSLLGLSAGTMCTCKSLGNDATYVICLKQIVDVVAMIPHKPTLLSGEEELRFFMVETPGMDIANFAEYEDEDKPDIDTNEAE
ncbi:hypothetical protein CONPUDRAFT_73881 [Coniophora puteana RWD-64-598 SS2]|uniref:Uncharacterized protein n=1 Tax=Coniophora puteana (strain RWD-64-598) TaxID=741705 RepID=A0A5M3MQS7_CONPW|nr:uncharacterized protein CONPUDRAFT_73881 [Coniophora puteana RWD-64-598 SS2]EIW80871.1 hypothetical protein CONPUDRAFT_73881 [Coniophora puteana RWD-64-598 SS2]